MKTKSASPLRAALAAPCRRFLVALVLPLAAAALSSAPVHAQTITSAVPGLISYQGKVSNANGTLVGAGTPVNRTVTFRIWSHQSNSTIGDLVYSEQQTVTISEGEFSVLVGQGTAVSGTPLGYSETAKGPSATTVSSAAVFGGAVRYLGVTIDDGTGAADPEVSPRQQLVTSAYAMRAKYAESLGANGNNSLYVTDAGNVGIGTTTPGAPLTFAPATGEKIGLYGGFNYGIGVQPGALQIHTHAVADDVTFGYGPSASMTETMRIKGNGNVGIGTSTPSAKLDVNGTVNVFDGTKAFGAGIVAEAGAGMINFGINDARFGSPQANSSQGGFLRVNTQGSVGSNLFQFYARPTNGSTISEVVSITGSGNVGIGNTSPTSTLHVNGGITSTSLTTGALNLTGPIATSGNVATHTQGAYLEWNKAAGGGQTYLLNQRGVGSGGMIFGEVTTADAITENMRIAAGGNVSLGTTSGEAKLNVFSSTASSATNTVLFRANGINSGANTSHIHYGATGDIYWRSAAATGMVVLQDTGGNVGIGTNAPGAKLHVAGGGIRVDGSNTIELGGGVANKEGAAGRIGYNTYSTSGGLDIVGSGSTGGGDRIVRIWDRLGIGTSSPTVPLQISASVSTSFNQQWFADADNGSGDRNANAIVSMSIRANGSIVGGRFDIESDARIKQVAGLSNGAADLATLGKIQITDFSYRDVRSHGQTLQKKVIAQQVEEFLPSAVTKSVAAIPDIYQPAAIAQGWIELATDLKVGDRVQLMVDEQVVTSPVLEVQPTRFRVEHAAKSAKVFVYGREVKDFRTVDYDAIAMLNVSATQELARENAALRAANVDLERRLAEVESKDRARDAKLASIEKLLQSASSVMAQPAKSATSTTQQ